jgi:SAM-dependent methyltransferase
MAWDSGYISEIGYTYGYYRELNPALLRLACLYAGVVPPPPGPLNYLELGFGQGVSINIHAAAFAGEFWGTDFNPAQAGHARLLANASRSGAVLVDESFTDLAARSDLPEFDVIALHGIWSWVSAESRQAIVDIVRRKLRPGGIVYISYNCLPGWNSTIPLRHLLALHVELAGSPGGGVTGKIDSAFAFAQRLVDSGAYHFKINPGAVERLKAISTQDRAYVAHEYFNRHWEIMSFSDVARCLEDAKLTYATSAHLVDNVDSINLTPEWQTLLADIHPPMLRHSVQDYLVNRQFRRDIFVKGSRSLPGPERAELLREQAFVLLSRPEDITMKVAASAGQVTLNEQIYRPLIEIMAQDAYSPKTMDEIGKSPTLRGLSFNDLASTLMILTGAGHAHPAQAVTKQARERCKALNRFLCQQAIGSTDIATLASPVTGSGVNVDRFQKLFLLAEHQDRKTASGQAAFAWETLSSQGQGLVKDGKPLGSVEENIAELTRHVAQFATRMPLLKALGVGL